MGTVLAAALSVGFLNGFLHCSGMCGPFVLSFSLAISHNHQQRQHRAALVVWHNAGRIAGFAVLY
ncbi:MAG: hypothetical protein C7B45_07825 [Sulfobacillus acidophilus]|uniref:Urease accessory protein UreH-like transmembrane domain-containing protein n=1 Tax=Sulfobacillus acidophilus TaxID=53633 RepID=A0A2T2WIR5_9FIRM|nr:MAG: hypothetical protein C7B45_07825 [Sulfobacillus acidophilus]